MAFPAPVAFFLAPRQRAAVVQVCWTRSVIYSAASRTTRRTPLDQGSGHQHAGAAKRGLSPLEIGVVVILW
jgi:hypothetical protein